MKVAVVSESFLPTVNGVTNSVCRVLDHLAREGHDAIVIAPHAGAPASFAGFPVHQVPAVAYRRFPVGLPSPQVARLLEDFAPDVLHAASPFLLGGHALNAARKAGIPSVAIYQTDVAGYAKRNRLGVASKLAWQFVRRIHESADRTLAPSTAAAQDCIAAGIPRLALWGRGVDIELYHPRNRLRPSALALRNRLTSGGRTVVGYVGRIAPEKQVERLRELAGLSDITIAIVGDGPAEPVVRRALRGQHVVWLGRLSGEALADAYASFDLFVHTGTEETFGQTIQEAQAAGLAVIAPHAGGPIDLVDDGTDGLLFDPAEAGALRRSVDLLLTSPALRARWGEAGRRKVLGRSWSGICDQLLGHYRDVIGLRHAPAADPLPAPIG